MKPAHYLIVGFLLLNVSMKEITKPVVHEVKMEGMRFNPNVVEIKAGETVRWINKSSASHNVVALDKTFESKMLTNPGDQFEYNFKTAGKFHYFCQPHKIMGMKGIIIVRQSEN